MSGVAVAPTECAFVQVLKGVHRDRNSSLMVAQRLCPKVRSAVLVGGDIMGNPFSRTSLGLLVKCRRVLMIVKYG